LGVTDFPSGFAYVSAALQKAGHEVYGLNLNNVICKDAQVMLKENLIEALKVKPGFVGLGGLCIDYKFIRDCIKIIRENSEAKIVLGGHIASCDPGFMKVLNPDHLIIGEGEEGFVKVCNGEYRRQVINSQPLPIDEIPYPDYDSFGIKNMVDNFSIINRMLYRYSRKDPRPFIIVTARGCPYSCTFCKKHPEGYRPRSIENIIGEIKENYEKYKFNILIMQDELFAVNKKRTREFCETLIEKKKEYGWDFDWLMQTHANSKLDEGTLRLAKESGMYLFSYGLESASNKILKSMKKHIKIEQIVEAIELADKVRVGFAGNLIIGDPNETEDTIRESLDFYFKHGIDAAIFLSYIQPYPGSEIFDYCMEKGIIKDKQTYYENIDKKINMTSIEDSIFTKWLAFNGLIEGSYLMIKSTEGKLKKIDKDYLANAIQADNYQIDAICPHCGEEVSYNQIMHKDQTKGFFVPLCQNCNKRIRVNLVGVEE